MLADKDDIRTTEFDGALRMFTNLRPYQEKLIKIVRLLEKDPSRETLAAEVSTGASSVKSVSVSIYSFGTSRAP